MNTPHFYTNTMSWMVLIIVNFVPCCTKESYGCPGSQGKIFVCSKKTCSTKEVSIDHDCTQIMIWSLHIPLTVMAILVHILPATDAAMKFIKLFEWVRAIIAWPFRAMCPTYLLWVLLQGLLPRPHPCLPCAKPNSQPPCLMMHPQDSQGGGVH